MLKLIRGILLFIGTLVLIIIGSAIALLIFVDPNHYKTEIATEIAERTGRTLTINGDIHWSFFPTLGLQTQDITLQNPAGFNHGVFATLSEATLRIALRPLFSSKLEVTAITMKGLTVNLITNVNGQHNWSTPILPTAATATIATPDTPTNTASVGPSLPVDWIIKKVMVRNAEMNIDNQQTGKKTQVHIAQAMAKDINEHNQPMDLSASVTITHNQPTITADFSLKTQVLADRNNRRYQLRSAQIEGHLSSSALNNKPIATKADFNATFDSAGLAINQIAALLDRSSIQGDIILPQHQPGYLNLTINEVNLTPYIQANTAAQPITHPSAGVANTVTLATPNPPHHDFWQKLNLTGQLSIHKLILPQGVIDNLQVGLHADHGIVHLQPMTAQVYGGYYQGQVSIDLQQTPLTYQSQSTFTQVQLGALLKETMNIDALSGTAQVTANVQASGQDKLSILQSLNGQIHLQVVDGAIQGIDILQGLKSVSARIKGEKPPTANSNNQQTPFAKLNASWSIQHGIAENQDLMLTSSLLTVTGKGTLDLMSEQLRYLLQAKITGDQFPELVQLQQQAGGTIPLIVDGTLAKPQITPDIATIFANITQQHDLGEIKQQVKQIKEKLGDQLKSWFGH